MQRTPAASRRPGRRPRASRARVRGWIGNTTGAAAASSTSAVDDRAAAAPGRRRWTAGAASRGRSARFANADRRPTPRARARASRSAAASRSSCCRRCRRGRGRCPRPARLSRRLRAVREQHVRQAVGEHAVDLLRHAPVERAQARLDVGDRRCRSLEAASAQRERGVHVAGDDARRRAGPRSGRSRTPTGPSRSARRGCPTRRRGRRRRSGKSRSASTSSDILLS